MVNMFSAKWDGNEIEVVAFDGWSLVDEEYFTCWVMAIIRHGN